MLSTVGSALDLMFLTPFVAMFCLQIIKSRIYFNFTEREISVSTVQQIFFFAVFNHIKFQAK